MRGTGRSDRDIEDVVDSTKAIFSFRRKKEVYFPKPPHDTFQAIDQGILKGQSLWKYVLSVKASKEPQPIWNKNAGLKKYQRLSPENLNGRKQQ